MRTARGAKFLPRLEVGIERRTKPAISRRKRGGELLAL
jgi:hypothetical protein